MTKQINLILDEVLKQIKPSKKELKKVGVLLKEFIGKLEKKKKNLKIDAQIFVGGSFAKKTLIKKEEYDVDIFIRFEKEHKNISKLTEKMLKGWGIVKVKGSRGYFKIKIGEHLDFEIVPVRKVGNPKEAKNITDLSYSHVKYIRKKIKSEKILDEIRIAKAFCHANECYGAESYINGFSGYGLELLVYHYGSFLKFIKAVAKNKEEKIIIDIEKHHRNKQAILMDINSSKLGSPIILIDPTYKQRNVAAALSEKTFDKFKDVCKEFLENPSISFFEKKRIDIEKLKKMCIARCTTPRAARTCKQTTRHGIGGQGNEFILISAKTNKQEGDIAGSKLLKFFNHLEKEIEKLFVVKKKGFSYEGGQLAKCFFIVKKKKEILFSGPYLKDKENVKKFKKKHKKTFVKKGMIYSHEKIKINIKKFLDVWKRKNHKKMQEMSVEELEV